MKKITEKILKRPVIAGMILGLVLTSSVTVGAMTTMVEGYLYTQNPIYSAPRGYAKTIGHKKITAKCSATKNGQTNSKKVTKKSGGTIETDWVYGPTYKSASTKFKSEHTGYTMWGDYKTLSAAKKY